MAVTVRFQRAVDEALDADSGLEDDLAIASLREALELVGTDDEVYSAPRLERALVERLRAVGELDQALVVVRTLRSREQTPTPRLLALEAALALQTGEPEVSATLAAQFVSTFTDLPMLGGLLSDAQLDRGDEESALVWARRAMNGLLKAEAQDIDEAGLLALGVWERLRIVRDADDLEAHDALSAHVADHVAAALQDSIDELSAENAKLRRRMQRDLREHMPDLLRTLPSAKPDPALAGIPVNLDADIEGEDHGDYWCMDCDKAAGIVPWMPADQYALAQPKLAETAEADGESYAEYVVALQRTMLARRREGGGRMVQVVLEVVRGESELRKVAEVVWPPGRNDACWCGSGRKYKRCCELVRAV